jgi:hypothetical protein
MPKPMTEPRFKVRELKDGSAYQVVMDPQDRAPDLSSEIFRMKGKLKSGSEKIQWHGLRDAEPPLRTASLLNLRMGNVHGYRYR